MRWKDGQLYTDDEQVHDLGSFECTGWVGNKRKYEGLSADVSKLPSYDNLETGSSAMCLDTGELYKYHAPTKKWHKV